MDNDAKSQRHNNQRGKLVLLDEHNFLKKKAKLAPKWSGPHRILKLNGPCNAELKLNINKKVVVNINSSNLITFEKEISQKFGNQTRNVRSHLILLINCSETYQQNHNTWEKKRI